MVKTGLAVVIGGFTPSEIMQAWKAGCDIVKLFPGSLGGPGYMRSFHGPYPQIPLMPTGGVSVENVAEWFRAGAVAVGAGSELCSSTRVQQGNFEQIIAHAKAFVRAVQEARIYT